MRKELFTLLLVTLFFQGRAQLSFGPEAGVNVSDYGLKMPGTTVQKYLKAGARAGVVANKAVNAKIDLQAGIFYVQNGYHWSSDGESLRVSINTAEIPVQVQYHFYSADSTGFFIGAGPYIAFNAGGTQKWSGNYNASESLRTGADSSGNLKVFDFGMGVNAGYKFANGIFVRARVHAGLLNLQPKGDSDNSLKSFNFGVSAGYFLPRFKSRPKATKEASPN